MKIFISCVSSEFKSYRLKLAAALGALKGQPCEIRVQEDFQQGGHTLLGQIADYVRGCDVVVHLAGDACGYRPSAEHVAAMCQHLGEPAPAVLPDHSATQWEYHLARQFGIKTLVYLVEPQAPRDRELPIQQDEADARLQREHRSRLEVSGKHHKPFSGQMALVREVFYDLDFNRELLKVNNLPFASIASLFKGRDAFLGQIERTFGQVTHRGHTRVAAITASAQSAAVHGLGGIGKTRAAVEYARRHADAFTALLFVRADSPENLHTNLAALCGASVLDLAEKDARETSTRVAAALRWLQSHPGWFLILDNVDTPEAARAVEDLLASLSTAGQVLITSRIAHWSGAIESLQLDVLRLEDAADYLLEDTQGARRPAADDAAQALRLAETLGQLPLALTQAAAYIRVNRLTLAQYQDHWHSRHAAVTAWFDERLMKYPKSVAVTWQTSFDQLSPAARELLNVLAWFAPDPIPESLLDIALPPNSDSGEQNTVLTPDNLREALGNLASYSLANREEDAPIFFIHKLVQDVTRTHQGTGVQTHRLPLALNWINDAFVGSPLDVRTWPVLDPLLPHALRAAHFADEQSIATPTARLLNECALLLQAKAQFQEAEPLMRRALAIFEISLGGNHPNVATQLNNLAQLLQDTNRLAEAEPLMRRALVIDESSYGKNHPQVAIHLNNLAQLLQDTNRLAEAEPLMRRALEIDEHSYGENHPKVAIRLNNLATLLQATNRLAEAEPLMRRALVIDESSYGENHPRVAIDLNNLAQLLKATNRLAEAEPLMRRALLIDESSYGENNPNVARDLNNLAQLLQATNRLAEAEPLIRRALEIDESSYGENHPLVAIRLNNLAALLHATNRLAEAEPMMRRMVEIFLDFTQRTGHPHPHLQAAAGNYEGLLKAIGRSPAEIQEMLKTLGEAYGIETSTPL